VSEVVHTAGGARFIPNYLENRLKFSPYVKDAAVMGAGRDDLTALVCIDFAAVGHWAEEHGVTYTSYADLSSKPEAGALIAQVVRHVNGLVSAPLAIRRFVLLPKEFDPDDGEVTRTRNVVEAHYAPVITALYDGSERVTYETRITYESGSTGVLKRELAVRTVPS
jgi:long-chain acyl-CoA synthetase